MAKEIRPLITMGILHSVAVSATNEELDSRPAITSKSFAG
jgi:hypothetical protein